ncbi:methyltransferase N6AMT1-like isoform X1 [Daktulosphaira vitifoliae]|uniref:methyltransferase N6AMT1-like isoform X1 n=1 Tax=Daktulosphaira vitifoliae TaxID=58002 RepID=UPI0021AA58E1|nr:methyltransferase N6AMT1-like isoform X1 [Daktulosphaira vitifoliae]
METPDWNSNSVGDDVYEPSEDTFLLLDALENDLNNLKKIIDKGGCLVLELGSGSGVITAALKKTLGSTVQCIAVDINLQACHTTLETCSLNNVNVDVINANLLDWIFQSKSIDIIIFNPPYVRSFVNEGDVDGKISDIKHAWCGGPVDGADVIRRVLPQINRVLADNGVFYLLMINYNNPEKIAHFMAQEFSMAHNIIITRKVPGESLVVYKFYRT